MRYLFLILLLWSFSHGSFSQAIRLKDGGNVSMIEVLLYPEKFDDKPILLQGIFIYEFDQNALYLSKESAEYGVSAEAVWIRFSDGFESDRDLEKLNGKYVSIYGTFDKEQLGPLGNFRGSILVESILLSTRYRKL